MNNDLSLYDVTFVIVVGTLVVLLLMLFIVFFFITYNRKHREHLLEVARLKHEFAQALLQAQLEIQEQTLQHIAYELHDNLGQVASLIKINLNTLQLHDTHAAGLKIEDTKELIRQLITDLKMISLSLNSDRVATQGLEKGLEIEVDRLARLGQFAIDFKHDGIAPTLEDNTTIIIYRMAQEILNNMVKHSRARKVEVSLQTSKNLLTLAFSDDGVGFDREEKLKNGGSGLTNLQNRARLIQANLRISTAPGLGTTISIELPV